MGYLKTTLIVILIGLALSAILDLIKIAIGLIFYRKKKRPKKMIDRRPSMVMAETLFSIALSSKSAT
jgi:hypothetical protein